MKKMFLAISVLGFFILNFCGAADSNKNDISQVIGAINTLTSPSQGLNGEVFNFNTLPYELQYKIITMAHNNQKWSDTHFRTQEIYVCKSHRKDKTNEYFDMRGVSRVWMSFMKITFPVIVNFKNKMSNPENFKGSYFKFLQNAIASYKEKEAIVNVKGYILPPITYYNLSLKDLSLKDYSEEFIINPERLIFDTLYAQPDLQELSFCRGYDLNQFGEHPLFTRLTSLNVPLEDNNSNLLSKIMLRMTQLESITFENKGRGGINVNNFLSFPKLRTLMLNYFDYMRNIDQLSHLTELKDLAIKGIGLYITGDSILPSLTQLKKLSIDHLIIISLPSLGKMVNLESLCFTEAPRNIFNEEILKLTKLKRLAFTTDSDKLSSSTTKILAQLKAHHPEMIISMTILNKDSREDIREWIAPEQTANDS